VKRAIASICAGAAAAALAAFPVRAQELPRPQTFAQLSLADAQRDALVQSPDVAIARAKVQEAQALFDEARATLGPALIGGYTEGPQGGTNDQTVVQRLANVGAQWTLGDLIAYSPQVAQANAALRSAQFALNDAQRTQQIAAIAAYYGALQAHAVVQARSTEFSAANAELRAAKLRFGSGDAPRVDVVRASVAVAQAQADLARAQASEGDAYAALAQATGLASSALEATVPTDAPPVPIVQATVDAATARALAVRPDVASAREDVAAEEHAVALARRGGLPLVTISGGYTSGVDTGVKVSGPNANVEVTYPVGGAAHDRVLAEEARLAEAQAELTKVERDVTLEVGSAVRQYQAESAALIAAERGLHDAQLEFNATQVGYRNGASSSLDLESSRTAYVGALVSQIAALYAQAQAQTTLQLVMGDKS
jgi:outer membrane protein TolC